MSRLKLTLSMAVVLLLAVSVGTALAQEVEPEFIGTAVISDDEALSDAITYTLANVLAPSFGTEYVGWLISDDGSRKLNTGAMTVAEDGTVTHSFDSNNSRYTGENLIQNYSVVTITEEAAGADPDVPAGPIVFSHEVPPGVMEHIRHLLADWPLGSGVGILTNLKLQLGVALVYANLANDQASMVGVKQHLEHVINAIEGPGGDNYGDLDGNGAVEDFGDGIGVIAHAQDRKHAALAFGQALDDEVIEARSEAVDINGKNAEDFANQAASEALIALKETNLALAKLSVAGVIAFVENALDGVDADASGTIDSVAGEGAAAHAYVEAQLMATYTLQVGPLPTPVPPTLTPEPTATPVPPVSVGDTAVPALALLALLTSVLFLVGGGLIVLRRRPRA